MLSIGGEGELLAAMNVRSYTLVTRHLNDVLLCQTLK